MPLTLRPPRPGKTPNFEIRGTYLGVRVEVSSGTHKRSVAVKRLREIEECIETHKCYPAPGREAPAGPDELTFLSAAIAHMQAGGERKFIAPLIRHFGETPLPDIDQAAIDRAAITIRPNVSAATRNRAVYAPISAVLHRALGDKCPTIRRPEGYKGRTITDFMWPVDAFAIIDAADAIDPEFGLYLLVLLYTGIRKSEGRTILADDVQPDENAAWLRDSKNGDPRMLKLRGDIIDRIRAHLKTRKTGERLFKFNEGGHFKHLLLRATMAACGLDCPKRRPVPWKKPKFRLDFVGFHTFRHTWATWMRRYGGLDLQGLTATKNWRDERSAKRYAHVVSRDEWDRVDSLPAMGKIRGKAVND
jgi:integrase